MADLNEKSLEEAIASARALCADRGERLSFAPAHVVYRPSDLDDPRNVVKLLLARRALRNSDAYRSIQGGFLNPKQDKPCGSLCGYYRYRYGDMTQFIIGEDCGKCSYLPADSSHD